MNWCKSYWCTGKQLERSKQMSTPAENTRYKRCVKDGSLRNVEKQKKRGGSLHSRDQRQEIKNKKQLKAVSRKNDLVLSWLVKTHSVKNRSDKESAKTNVSPFEGIKGAQAAASDTYSWKHCFDRDKGKNPFDSNSQSKVSEISFKPQFKQTVEKIYKVVEPPIMSDDEIHIGQSAMSGRSSAAKRRLEKSNRMKLLASQHGKNVDYRETNSQYGHDDDERLSLKSGQSKSTHPYQHVNSQSVGNEALNNEQIEHDLREADAGRKSDLNADEVETEKDEDVQRNKDENDVPEEGEEKKESIEFGEQLLEQYKKRLDENDNSVFYDMFELIITSLASVHKEIRTVKTEQAELNRKVCEVERTIDVYTQSIDDLDTEMSEVNDVNIKLIQAIISNEERVCATAKSLNKIANRWNRGSFIINGVHPKTGQEPKEAIQSFFKEQLEIPEDNPIQLQSAHMMGSSRMAPIWFKLLDPDDTARIFENVSKLKGKTNDKGKSYKLREFSSEEVRAKKARFQDIKMENKRLPESHQVEIRHKQDSLYVNSDKYQKQVPVPTLKDALLLNGDQEVALSSVPLHEGDSREEEGSLFHVYAVEADGYEQVLEGYNAVNNGHLSASVIVCGYRLFGSRFYEMQDYQDSHEHGGGKVVLDAIKSTKVWNIAVYIVRYHNGPELGGKRFDIMREMTKQVIAKFPRPLNYGQFFADQSTLRFLNEAVLNPEITQPKEAENKRGRTGRGVRGGRKPRR